MRALPLLLSTLAFAGHGAAHASPTDVDTGASTHANLLASSAIAPMAPIRPETRPWPGGVVHFRFASGLAPAFRDAVRLSIAEFTQKTRIRFLEAMPMRGEGFLTIAHGDGTYVSHVGYLGDGLEQFLYFWPGDVAIWGVATHELGHVIGLEHEIQRCDRNSYVWIPAVNGNNEMLCDTLTVGPYDTYSAMAYSEVEMHGVGSVKGSQSEFIWPHWTPPKSVINGLTEIDLARIATLYGTDGDFSLVNVSSGKCLSAGGGDQIGPPRARPSLRTCDGDASQRWHYDAERRSLTDQQGRCVESAGSYGRATLAVCDAANPYQRWAVGEHGFITAASMDAFARDADSVPVCLTGDDSLADPGASTVVSRTCTDSDSARWVAHDFAREPMYSVRGSLVSYALVDGNDSLTRLSELCIGKRNGPDGLAKLQPCVTTSRQSGPRAAQVVSTYAGPRAHERQYLNDENLCLGANASEGALLSWRPCAQLGDRAWKRVQGQLYYVGASDSASWCVVVDTPAGAPNSGHPGHELVRPDWGLRLTSQCPAPWIAQPATMRWAFRDAATQPLGEVPPSGL